MAHSSLANLGVMAIGCFLIFSTVFIDIAVSTDLCSKSVNVGDSDFRKHSDHLDELSGVIYLVTSTMYRFPCCGLIHAVKTHTLKNGDVRFLVWRPTDETDLYQIAGDFRIEITNAPRSGAVIPTGTLQLQVQPRDLIGWYVPGESSIPYVNGKTDGHVAFMAISKEPTLGDVVDFSKATKETNRVYAVVASLDEDKGVPEFKGTAGEVQLTTDNTIGTEIMKISVFDPQLQDAIVSLNTNPYFGISDGGRGIVLKATPTAGVYELELTSTSLCGLSDTANVTVTVVEVTTNSPTEATLKSTEKTTTAINKPETSTEKTLPSTETVTTLHPETSSDPVTIEDSANIVVPDENIENTTIGDYYLSPMESQTSTWKVLTGISASVVLLVCISVIGRYTWLYYGGRFRAKTASSDVKDPVPATPDKENDPEAAVAGDALAASTFTEESQKGLSEIPEQDVQIQGPTEIENGLQQLESGLAEVDSNK